VLKRKGRMAKDKIFAFAGLRDGPELRSYPGMLLKMPSLG
jgi:hypothetical protein